MNRYSKKKLRKKLKRDWRWSYVSVNVCTLTVTLISGFAAVSDLVKALESIGITSFVFVKNHTVRLAEEDLNWLLLHIPGGGKLSAVKSLCHPPPKPCPTPPPCPKSFPCPAPSSCPQQRPCPPSSAPSAEGSDMYEVLYSLLRAYEH